MMFIYDLFPENTQLTPTLTFDLILPPQGAQQPYLLLRVAPPRLQFDFWSNLLK